ncbi:NADH-quinone oxidoreductase subunit N [Sulfurospirillum arcachonense]|uniref:NADH-quinone oxidoreductase subunit N n=1 Tax=Sulfurospirillum arcachonense TaxID=57666 RepID=UPI000469F895|nr:NADH-quinone oxidoreductase subunit N [Sulfurospirillum arcachonense]
MQTPDITYLLPLFFVGVGAILLMILSTFKNINIKKGAIASLVFLTLAIVSNIYNLNTLGDIYSVYPFSDVFNNMIVVDTYASYFSTILILGGILTILIGLHYFQRRKEFTVEFFSLLLFSVFGMMLLVHANELITAFIALEIASISLYIMIGFEKVIDKRIEASYKYLVLGSLAGVFFLLGSSFIYGATGTTSIGEIGIFVSNNIDSNMSLIILGGTMILITFLFKIAAFPFQNWAIDVYDGASLPVTAFMAATFKAAVFGFILRLVLVDFDLIRDFWDDMFVYIIIFTLAYGSFLAIIQKSLKRMLVSSSIVHTGYLLIAFVSIGVIGENAASSIIFYLVAYFLSALGAFGLIAYISSEDQLRITYDDFRGFSHIRPYMAAMLSVFMLSLAGIPSTIGFIGKFYIFTGAIESGNEILAIVGITATFVSVYYYFKLIAVMYFYRSPEMTDVPPLKGIAPLVIAVIALMIIWGGIGNTLIAYFPGVDFLIDMAKLSYKSLFIL